MMVAWQVILCNSIAELIFNIFNGLEAEAVDYSTMR
jgi:hypothetical protein